MSFSADSALEYLQRAHKKNRLAHAYLISGPAGSGKSDVAARLAAALNKTTPEKVLRAQAPDVFVTEPASRTPISSLAQRVAEKRKWRRGWRRS